MARLSKERNSSYRIHWKFKVKLGPRAGETFEGSLLLGRCTKTAAKAKQREIEEWEERVKTGRFVPDRNAEEVFKLWLRERELTCTPQTLERSERVMVRFRKWRDEQGLPCQTVEQLAVREDIIRWRHNQALFFMRDQRQSRKRAFLAGNRFFEKLIREVPVHRLSRWLSDTRVVAL